MFHKYNNCLSIFILFGTVNLIACKPSVFPENLDKNSNVNVPISRDSIDGKSKDKKDRIASTSKLATYELEPLKAGEVRSSALALVSGKLLVKDSCLVIQTDGKFLQPVFPFEKTIWDDEKGLLIFNGKQYREGDDINLGGGGVSNEGLYRQMKNVSIPSCSNFEIFVVG